MVREVWHTETGSPVVFEKEAERMDDILKMYQQFQLTPELIKELNVHSKSNSSFFTSNESNITIETVFVKDGEARVIAKERIYG